MDDQLTALKICVVTPVHNGRAYTQTFLRSLDDQKLPPFHTIIVDDGSTDGTADMVKMEFPNVRLLSGDGNLWWSGATNLGVKHALTLGATHILTVNNDVELANDAIQQLARVAVAHPDTLVGSVIKDLSTKAVWYAGGNFDDQTGELQHRFEPFSETTATSNWLTGMGALIPAGAYAKVGLYDQKRFPQYFGDADFSLRAKAAGYELLVCRDAVIYADTRSSWLNQDYRDKPWRFIWDVLFSIRSQYNVAIRLRFYRRYWPAHRWRALARIYRWVGRRLILPFIRYKVQHMIRGDKP